MNGSGKNSPRDLSIDLVRGAVMILMVIDHVRVFAGVPAGGADPAVFFTRWVTHFCAPAFVFLAGTSAFLYARKHDDLPRFLLTRGLWLIVLDLTVMRLAWTFNFDFAHHGMAGVLWVIGWSLIALAGLSRLPLAVVAGFGALVVAGHNLLDGRVATLLGSSDGNPVPALWKLLYLGFFAGPIEFAGPGSGFWVLYSFVPWVGVIALGYAFGAIILRPSAERTRRCLALGLGATFLFLVLRALDLYGDPSTFHGLMAGNGGRSLPPLLAFLNTAKYPASLQFLLMTLGPMLALLPLLTQARGAVAGAIALFGRVPFFFYLLHIPLAHALALVVSKVRLGAVDPWLFTNHPMANPPAPQGYRWSLPLLYAIWAIALVILYFACRWFARLKAQREDWWLRYL
jgi:uncharacterized membrane protein